MALAPDAHTLIVAIRHGETAWNQANRIQGHTDIPLNSHGLWQAQRLAQALQAEPLHAIYSSDLQRAHDTARAVARCQQVQVVLEDGLRERHFGRLEGLTRDEIARHWPDAAQRWHDRDPDFSPDGGETLQCFYDRCVHTLTRLAERHRGQRIAVVAHGGVLDCFYRAASDVSLQAPRSWKVANATINRLQFDGSGFALIEWANNAHLGHAVALDERTDGAVQAA